MKTKIPPPVLVLIAVLVMWLVARYTTLWPFSFPAQQPISLAILSVGFLITIAAIVSFRQASTTVNPLAPEKATSLVTSGVFGFSRNPMYLGMAIVLTAWLVYLGSWLNLGPVILFCSFISRFQIIPEEQAMQKLFGASYQEYCGRVRRWL